MGPAQCERVLHTTLRGSRISRECDSRSARREMNIISPAHSPCWRTKGTADQPVSSPGLAKCCLPLVRCQLDGDLAPLTYVLELGVLPIRVSSAAPP